MLAIARAIGFPPEEWFEHTSGDDTPASGAEGRDLAARVGHLFDTVVHPKTGEPFTNAEVARMSAGVLAEGEVEGIRCGAIPDPTVGQVAALAAVFGVEPSYLVDGTREASLDREVVEALRDDTTWAIATESARLPDRERKLVLGIVREFEGARSPEGADRGAPSEDR